MIWDVEELLLLKSLRFFAHPMFIINILIFNCLYFHDKSRNMELKKMFFLYNVAYFIMGTWNFLIWPYVNHEGAILVYVPFELNFSLDIPIPIVVFDNMQDNMTDSGILSIHHNEVSQSHAMVSPCLRIMSLLYRLAQRNIAFLSFIYTN